MDFFGTGRGDAAGFPVEAVVQDLCDLRDNVDRMASVLTAVRDSQERTNATLVSVVETLGGIRGLLRELLVAVHDGIGEAQEFRSEMAATRQRVEEARDAVERDAQSRRAGSSEPSPS